MDAIVGSDEASEFLGVDRSTLIRWIAKGTVTPRHKLPGASGAYLFDRDEIERVAAELAKAS
jgi:predicted site-specific integrase-resolvase